MKLKAIYPLTCAYGEPWVGPHPLCDAAALRLIRQCAREIKAGKYDEEGYTKKERRAQLKRLFAPK